VDRILAIDVGTQSLMAYVVDRNLVTLERKQISYAPQSKAKDRVEIEAEILWEALINACRQL
jgi:sugar (pentulose or hexulose) kinase